MDRKDGRVITENISEPHAPVTDEVQRHIHGVADDCARIREQLAGTIVGMEDVTELLMIAILCRGHCILQGMPGLAKTLLVSQFAEVMNMSFRRIQFTPDLMPADITGSEVLEEDRATGRREFRFVNGPIFGNLILADEINRTPPKTQSALLEAMEERRVSIAGKVFDLPNPFFVLATQNPIEVEGTYPLPEAQLDRFLMNIRVTYPTRQEERLICERQTTSYQYRTKAVVDVDRILAMQQLVRRVIVADQVYDLALALTRTSRPEEELLGGDLKAYIHYGAGPRASIALLMAAKARALIHRRCHATTTDLLSVAAPILRHRIIPTFHAEAAGVTTDDIVGELVDLAKSQLQL